MRVLLDTNIVLDMLCKRPFECDSLEQLKVMHAFGDVELWASAKSYTDLFYIIRKQEGNAKAHELLEESFSWLHACSVDESDVKRSLAAHWDDFEDCLVNVCAEKVKASFLVTRDEAGFSKSKIPHGGAKQFMEFVFETTNRRYALMDIPEDTKPANP